MRRGRRLAIDVGDARIGVASCDPDGILATPVETVPGRDVPAAHRRLRQLVEEYEPIEVVVGLPRSLKGGEGPAAAKVRGFAQELARSIAPVPVRLVDERMTTVTASQGLRASGVKSKKGRSVDRPGSRRGHPAEALEIRTGVRQSARRGRRSGHLIAIR